MNDPTESICDGWPDRVPLVNGHEIDLHLLLWLMKRQSGSYPRWTSRELLHEVWLASAHLMHWYDPSKSKISTFLANYLTSHVRRSYLKQFRMATRTGGAGVAPLRPEDGWIDAVGDYGGSDLAAVDAEPKLDDPAHREILDVLSEGLAPRQSEVLSMFRAGLTLRQIADHDQTTYNAANYTYRKSIKLMRVVADELGVEI